MNALIKKVGEWVDKSYDSYDGEYLKFIEDDYGKHGKQFVGGLNASQVVTQLSGVLGIMLLATALMFMFYYYVVQFTTNNRRSYGTYTNYGTPNGEFVKHF